MKKITRALCTLLALAMCFALVACGETPAPAAAAPAAAAPAAAAPAAAAPAADSAPAGTYDAAAVTDEIIVGTAATSGMYYFVGAAVGNAIDQGSNMTVLVQSTSGSMENIGYAQSGDIHIGMANADALFGAYNGELSFKDVGKQDILQVAALYTSAVHMYTRADSGIKSWSDLKGKRVSLGASGTSYVYFCQEILKRYGINWETDMTPFYMDTGESAEKLADGDIDAAFLTGGAPLAGIEAQLASNDFYFISMTPEIIEQMCNDFSYFTPYTIKSGTYSKQDYDCETIGIMTCFFAPSTVSNESVYAFVKYMMDTLPSYQDTNTATREIRPETVGTQFIPLHPGAEAYYKEMGYLK